MIRKTQLYQEICQKWKTICFEDLHAVSSSKTSIYKLLDRCQKNSFSSDERLIFYSSHVPDLSLLAHLQLAVSIVDISNNFIMICCPGDIHNDLVTVQQDYSTDDVPIQHLKLDLEDTPPLLRDFYVPDTVCPLPWMHMEIGVQGEIRPCCVSQHTLGDVRLQSCQEIFHGTEFDNLRQQMLNGEKPSTCRHCYEIEDHGLQSNRIRHLEGYKKSFRSQWIDYPKIRSLDLKPGNTCNFSCRSCSPERSSMIAAENLKHTNDEKTRVILKDLIKKGRWFSDSDESYSQIEELLPNIETLEMTGGESLLEKNISRLIRSAAEKGFAQNIKLHFSTNGSIWPDDIVDYWQHYKLVDVTISIDDIGRRFETIRGGNWDVIENNTKKFLEFNRYPNFNFYLYPTVSILNILYLNELVAWSQSIGAKIVFNYLDSPVYLNIDNLTAKARDAAIKELDPKLHPEIANILKRLQKAPLSDGSAFCKAMYRLDHRRGQRFDQTHPEISAVMNYDYVAFSNKMC